VLSVPVRTIDRLIASFLLGRARRTWPLLTLVPSPFLRRLLTPTASRLRRSLQRNMLWVALAVGAAILLVRLPR
jgi:hypothetical protein